MEPEHDSLVRGSSTQQVSWGQQRFVAGFGMSLCMLGLALSLLEVTQAALPWSLQSAVSIFGWKQMTLIACYKSLFLTSGAVLLAILATWARNKLFIILEYSLVLWGILAFLPSGGMLFFFRLMVALLTWTMLVQSGLIGRKSIFGALGIEALSIGYLFGWNWPMLAGGVLICVHSFFGMAAPDEQTRRLSRFFCYFNAAFTLLATIVCVLELHRRT